MALLEIYELSEPLQPPWICELALPLDVSSCKFTTSCWPMSFAFCVCVFVDINHRCSLQQAHSCSRRWRSWKFMSSVRSLKPVTVVFLGKSRVPGMWHFFRTHRSFYCFAHSSWLHSGAGQNWINRTCFSSCASPGNSLAAILSCYEISDMCIIWCEHTYRWHINNIVPVTYNIRLGEMWSYTWLSACAACARGLV